MVLVAMIIAPATFSIEKYADRNKERAKRIKQVIDGEYQPKGLFDLFYGELDQAMLENIPPLSYFASYYE